MTESNFGLLFEALPARAGPRRVVKILHPHRLQSSQSIIEFDNEGDLLRKLARCSGVVDIVESGTVGLLQAAAPSIPCRFHILNRADASLDKLLVDPLIRAQIPWRERLAHWRAIVKCVHQMHLADVVHRDLKSANCLISDVSGGDTVIWLTDLGRSRDLSEPAFHSQHQYLSGLGDPGFAPPEHLLHQGASDDLSLKTADIYGLGSLLVELATGQSMSALAMGAMPVPSLQALQASFHFSQDLATLRPAYRNALNLVADEIPKPIRNEARALLGQLCDPTPFERLPRRAPGLRRQPSDGLNWLLRRTDIMIHQLDLHAKQQAQLELRRSARRNAS